MTQLARIRPSNLVILAVLPFVAYLFTMVPNYRRSITAIVGIEDGAPALFSGFVLLAVLLASGCLWPVLRFKFGDLTGNIRKLAAAAIGVNVMWALLLAAFGDVSALATSIVANTVDPSLSDLVVKAASPRRLTPEAAAWISAETRKLLWSYAAMSVVLAVPALRHVLSGGGEAAARWISRVAFVLNGGLLAYLLLGAHLGFASGLFTTLRAGIFAYLLATVLGLVWAGMLRITLKPRSILLTASLCAGAIAMAAVLFLQPHTTFVLAGSLDKSVAIVKGTPKSLVDSIRFGQFDVPVTGEIALRSAVSEERSVELLSAGEVSAVFLPAGNVPAGLPELWRTSFLPDLFQTPAIFLLVGGVLLGLLTFSAFQHNRHPLSVAAEFFIDTVRGIPMLVIILFVGLPFAGAVKDASGGTIDMPNVVRGVIAIAIGYSAYLAEIFRAGIDAVPRGQIEAGRALGFSNYHLARLIILPQAFRIVLPALGNEFIAILKDTSLLSILSVRDVTQRMREFQSASFLPFAPFNSAAILYVFLTLAAASLIASIERKYDVKHR